MKPLTCFHVLSRRAGVIVLLCVLLVCSLSEGTGGVAVQPRFQRTVGGTLDDLVRSIIQTTDSGYALVGYTFSFGAGLNDIYVVKLDMSGALHWTTTVGGSIIDEAYSIIQTADGGYAVAATTLSFGTGRNDMYVLRLDANGTLKWSRTIGGSMAERALSITRTTDGGLAVAGATDSFGAGSGDMYIVKLDSSGVLQWSRTLGAVSADIPLSIIQTADGGYALAGYTFSFGAGQNDVYIVKLDSSGTLQWNRTVGGTNYDYGQSIIQTADGGYAVAGYTQSFGAGNYDTYIVKLDSSGTLQWNRTIGGTNVDYAYSVIQTAGGGFAVVGSTRSFGAGNDDVYIVKLDATGTLQWSKTFGGIAEDAARSIVQTADGGFVVAGYTRSFGAGNADVYILKLDSSGTTCGNSTTPTSTVTTPTPTVDAPSPTVTTPASTVTPPSPTVGSGGMAVLICTTVGIERGAHEPPDGFALHQNYPNPFPAKGGSRPNRWLAGASGGNPATTISFSLPFTSFVSLKVFDALGREVTTLLSEQLSAGTYSQTWDAADLPSGVYFYRLDAAGFTQTKRMLLLR